MRLLALFVICYILGSITFGLVFTKLFKLPDLRQVGSKNVGATNALRSGNKLVGILTLMGDLLKGTIAVYLAKYCLNNNLISPPNIFNLSDVDLYNFTALTAGIFAILGHIFSIFVQFKGGKGVATYIGVMLAFNPLITLIFITIWFATAMISKYSSLSALMALIFATLSSFLFYNCIYILVALIFIAAIIIYCHRANILRLIQGTESKIGNKSIKS